MAHALDLFDCSICLGLLEDPVSTTCGHSYCMKCINTFWDTKQDNSGKYSCPQCRQTFNTRPVLKRNTILANLLEKHEKTTRQRAAPSAAASDDDIYAAPGDVLCDFCTGRKRKAHMFCQVCLASYCEAHLEPHFQVPPLQKHKLIKASPRIKESICGRHNKLQEIYCRTDRQFLCLLCAVDEHKGHNTISVTEEKREMQRHLEKTKWEIADRVLTSEDKMEKLMEAAQSIRDAAWEACDDFEREYEERILLYTHFMRKKCSEMREKVGEAEKAGVDWTECHRRQLKLEVSELRRRESEICQLSQTDDPIQFLQGFQALGDLPVLTDSHRGLDNLTKFVTEQKDKMKKMCDQEKTVLKDFSEKVIVGKRKRLQERYTRTELLDRYKNSKVEVDPNTVAACLHLSDTKKEISWCERDQAHPDHPNRFTYFNQALCKEGLRGNHYWEVEWDGGIVEVAVSYKGIERKGSGKDCCFGHNALSWKLICFPSGCTFWHNNLHKGQIPPAHSHKVGVHLDYEEGKLAFYSISGPDSFTLLHQIQTTFTEPLYPGFSVDFGAKLKICNI
ncbi:tripartite motif-containing protein 16-like [Archocentrus centrarchus]|uniref:tripartite motif-containing protein 16-like n=1 Tax=Archocentrus centrarchus TaxID=63155 RepID=UPI0011EA0FBB|nr:tripartite motif-containing protein 16-like [Archocentrus centrarchus]